MEVGKAEERNAPCMIVAVDTQEIIGAKRMQTTGS